MAYSTAMVKHFIGYVRQNYKVTALVGNPTGQYVGTAGGRCTRTSDDAAGRANTIAMSQKQRASSTPPIEAIQVNFADTAAQDTSIDAKGPLAPTMAPPPLSNSKECAYHATCSGH